MFSRKEVIEGRFGLNLDDNIENDELFCGVQEDEENSHAFGSLDDYSDCLLDDKIESKIGEEFDMKDEIREDLWETVVSKHPEFGVRNTDVPYEMKGLYPTTKTSVVPRSYEVLAVPCSREHVFIMSREEATSRASDESLTRISSMSQEFEQNNLGCPKLIKK